MQCEASLQKKLMSLVSGSWHWSSWVVVTTTIFACHLNKNTSSIGYGLHLLSLYSPIILVAQVSCYDRHFTYGCSKEHAIFTWSSSIFLLISTETPSQNTSGQRLILSQPWYVLFSVQYHFSAISILSNKWFIQQCINPLHQLVSQPFRTCNCNV